LYNTNTIDITGRGRVLVAHNDSDYEEWSASLTATIDPGASNRGLYLSIRPTWGGSVASSVDRLWDNSVTPTTPVAANANSSSESDSSALGIAAELGYGMGFGDYGLIRPFSQFKKAGSEQKMRLGSSLEIVFPNSMGMQFSVYGEQDRLSHNSAVFDSRFIRRFGELVELSLFSSLRSHADDSASTATIADSFNGLTNTSSIQGQYQVGVELKIDL
jgi:hypothetical protein